MPRPMHRRVVFGLVLLAALLPCRTGRAQTPQDSPVLRLSWLAGCWESERGDRRMEEQWMAPRGGTMLGMSRTVAGDAVREFEFLRISEKEGRLVLTARPSGQPEASFTSIEVTSSRVVFENPAHDFPQRIIYRLDADGSLAARIEGTQNGQARGVDFPMRRAKCPSAQGD